MAGEEAREAESPGFQMHLVPGTFGKAGESRCGRKRSEASGAFVPLFGKMREMST